ncbi:MAG: hypothetical protein AAGU12_15680, partial [Clostridiales bacterium]
KNEEVCHQLQPSHGTGRLSGLKKFLSSAFSFRFSFMLLSWTCPDLPLLINSFCDNIIKLYPCSAERFDAYKPLS